MGFKFNIEYKRGITNKAADALSRKEGAETSSGPSGADAGECAEAASLAVLAGTASNTADGDADGCTETTELLALAARPMPRVLDLLRFETASIPTMVTLTRQIQSGIAPRHFSWADGLIYFNRRVLVDVNSKAKKELLTEHHCSPMAGHPGHERTFRLLAAAFYWPKMRQDVKAFVDQCVVCQSTKYSTRKPAGLLQPLPVPSQVWEDVSMDFITGLPQSRGYSVIMVVVDRLSKYAHFAPLPTRFDALRVAHLFVNTVVRHHGFPKTLVSDRDSVFLNATWEEIMRLSGTKLQFSTAYHPESDGQTEVRNRGLEQYLRAFTADKPSQWTNFLPWAELALNCHYHSALGTSPYRALYGREPPSLVAAPPSAKTPPKAAELIRGRGELLVQLRRNLERARKSMAATANQHRRHVEFEIGELVWLKLQPYRQHSVAKPLSAKISKRYYGPFEVLEQIGPVAYRLRLPEGSRIHNVFHVSLLKEFVAGEGDQAGVPLPGTFMGDRPISVPTKVLETRDLWRDGKPTPHARVRWSDGFETTTWEPAAPLKEKYPDLFLEDKEDLNGEGVDRNSEDTTSTPSAEAGPSEVEESETRSADGEDDESVPDGSSMEPGRELRPRKPIKYTS